jgi:hypothetical protein
MFLKRILKFGVQEVAPTDTDWEKSSSTIDEFFSPFNWTGTVTVDSERFPGTRVKLPPWRDQDILEEEKQKEFVPRSRPTFEAAVEWLQ